LAEGGWKFGCLGGLPELSDRGENCRLDLLVSLRVLLDAEFRRLLFDPLLDDEPLFDLTGDLCDEEFL
jgi:hypothetical protein